MAQKTVSYTPEMLEARLRQRNEESGDEVANVETKVIVVAGDCLEVAEWCLHKRLSRPLVLNMASARNPGGGYQNGAGAQEENLFRRTSLVHSLEDPYRMDPQRAWAYPIPEFGGIYSPAVLYFRASEARGYSFLERPLRIDVVSVAAYTRPPVERGHEGHDVLSRRIAECTRQKIRAILNIAKAHGRDHLVLSALGCGAYRNPPMHIAKLFKEVLNYEEFRNSFSLVAFAIIDDHNALKRGDGGNVAPFARVFETNALSLDQLWTSEELARCD